MAGERHPVFWDPDDDQLYRRTKHGGVVRVKVPAANLAASASPLPSRLGIANGWVLSVDDTAPTGMSWVAPSGGGGGGAPTNASYVVVGADATLTDERVLTAGTGILLVDGGAGSTMTVNLTGRAEQLHSATGPGLVVVDSGGSIQLTPLVAGTGISINDPSASVGSPLIALADASARSVLGVSGASAAAPTPIAATVDGQLFGRQSGVLAFWGVSLFLDSIGSTRGDMLVRQPTGWSVVAPGTSGYVLTSNGPGVEPTWQASGGSGGITEAQVAARVLWGV